MKISTLDIRIAVLACTEMNSKVGNLARRRPEFEPGLPLSKQLNLDKLGDADRFKFSGSRRRQKSTFEFISVRPLVIREEGQRPASVTRPILPSVKDERIVSLFQNSPKPRIELSRSKVPPVLRRGQFALYRLMEILKAMLQEKEKSQVLSEVAAPRTLLVPKLPHPHFKTPQPARFFFSYPKNEHLMSDTQEDWPTVVMNSARLCSYARQTLPCRGHLKQDADGFVYLELSDNFVAELFPLLGNQELEPCLAGQIPVIMPHEWALRKGLGELKELGDAFSFEITNLSAFQPMRWPDVEKVYFLRLHCPELERLREKFLLPSRILGHDFHVPIAFKPVRHQSPQQREIFRLNVSCFAA